MRRLDPSAANAMTSSASSNCAPLRAAVVGLGKVGSRFDEEEGRTSVWSHVGAYLKLPGDFNIVAAVEPLDENRVAFETRLPTVPVFKTTEEMILAHNPEVCSICTPPQFHGEVLDQLLAATELKAVWCEKPLADDLEVARHMADACANRGLAMVVTHNRRFMPLWREAKKMKDDGAVGLVRCVRVAMPNRRLSIGSHAIDLAIMLGGPVERVMAMEIPTLFEEGEEAFAAMLAYANGAYGIVQVTGMKAQLVVEAEILGDEGRILVREDKDSLELERFVDKPGIEGYYELKPVETTARRTPSDHSAFVDAARELADLARGDRKYGSCSAVDALAVMEILDEMIARRFNQNG